MPCACSWLFTLVPAERPSKDTTVSVADAGLALAAAHVAMSSATSTARARAPRHDRRMSPAQAISRRASQRPSALSTLSGRSGQHRRPVQRRPSGGASISRPTDSIRGGVMPELEETRAMLPLRAGVEVRDLPAVVDAFAPDAVVR